MSCNVGNMPALKDYKCTPERERVVYIDKRFFDAGRTIGLYCDVSKEMKVISTYEQLLEFVNE